jgi:RNA polymerase sigma-70 factor (TIGR02960 family)
VSAELIARAQAGDGEAFGELVDPYRRELQLHCYRILGSLQDAEDAMQEAMLAAWQGLRGFEQRASIRTWLYQVATSRCLNALRAASRRPQMSPSLPGVDPPEPTRLGELTWLEPYPDFLIEGFADTEPGPEARYEATETVSLAFITALQLLPPRQRAVLILRDVLSFRAAEVAGLLESSQESVTSALKRARATLQRELSPAPDRQPPPPPDSGVERELVDRLTRAYDAGDVDALVALLTEDVELKMPPVPLEYQGRELVAEFFRVVGFRENRTFRMIPTRANGQPAFGAYVRDPRTGIAHANGLLVLTLSGDRISCMTRFDNSLLSRFGLPRALPAE